MSGGGCTGDTRERRTQLVRYAGEQCVAKEFRLDALPCCASFLRKRGTFDRDGRLRRESLGESALLRQPTSLIGIEQAEHAD